MLPIVRSPSSPTYPAVVHQEEELIPCIRRQNVCEYKVRRVAKSILFQIQGSQGFSLDLATQRQILQSGDVKHLVHPFFEEKSCLSPHIPDLLSPPVVVLEEKREDVISLWEKSMKEVNAARPLPKGKVGGWIETAIDVWDFGEDAPDSSNRIRDKILSGGSSLGLLGELSLVMSGPVPSFVWVAGAEIVAKGAKSLEEDIQKMPPMAALSEPPGVGSEMISFAESKLVVEMALKALQMPAEAFHIAHQFLETQAITFCDKTGLTEKRILDFIRELILHAPTLGSVPIM